MKPQLAANNPLPSENCTKEEAISYLQKHIEHQNDRIDELTNALRVNENDRQTRAWAIDFAIRSFGKDASPTADDITERADAFRAYADVAPEVPNAVN